LNVHASILPELRGAAPAQWAIARGFRETGVTLMQMDEGLDTGDMLLQKRIPIAADETGESLLIKLGAVGSEILREGIPLLEAGKLIATAQHHGQATLAPILTREDGRIEWTKSAQEIDERRRGFSPWPGAWTILEGAQLKIHGAQPIKESTQLPPGEIVRSGKDGIEVACGEGTILRITELQPEGKKRMSAQAFLAGHPLAAGTRLG
jgi:methionyl-tRNA formyltransferase